MGRQFLSASSQFLENTSAAVITTVPYTLAAWFYPFQTNVAGAMVGVGVSASVGTVYLAAGGGAKVQAFSNAATSASTSTSYLANTWQHAAGVYTSITSRAAYLNGTGKGTSATSIAAGSYNRTAIGRQDNGSPSTFFNGLLAEVGIWNVALTDAEVMMLAQGVPCTQVRPQNLAAYYPLTTPGTVTEFDANPFAPRRYDMTVTGPTPSIHPPLRKPPTPLSFAKATGATRNASASLTCLGRVSAAAKATHNAIAALTCLGRVTATAKATHNAIAALTCLASIGATAKVTHNAIAALTCLATVGAAAQTTHNAIAAMTCQATVTATAKVTHNAQTALQCVWTVQGVSSVVRNANASLTATWGVLGASQVIRSVTASLTCQATITATATQTVQCLAVSGLSVGAGVMEIDTLPVYVLIVNTPAPTVSVQTETRLGGTIRLARGLLSLNTNTNTCTVSVSQAVLSSLSCTDRLSCLVAVDSGLVLDVMQGLSGTVQADTRLQASVSLC